MFFFGVNENLIIGVSVQLDYKNDHLNLGENGRQQISYEEDIGFVDEFGGKPKKALGRNSVKNDVLFLGYYKNFRHEVA